MFHRTVQPLPRRQQTYQWSIDTRRECQWLDVSFYIQRIDAFQIADNGGLRIAYTAYRRYLKSFHLSSVNHGKHRQQQLLPGLNLTDEQLFYLGFAQTWCTKMTPQAAESALATDAHAYPKYRVIGALSNMPEFSRAFHCLSGSLMNPSRRCQIWSQSESA